METDGGPLPAMSPAAKGILAAAGVSITMLIGLLGLAIFKCLRRATRSLTHAQATKGKKGAAKPKQQQQQQRSQQQQKQQVMAAHAEPLERGMNFKELKEAEKRAEKSRKAAAKDDHASGHALFLNTLKGHGDAVHSVAWNTEGKQLVTACEDMVVRVFDVLDVTTRNQKYTSIRAAKIPQGAGFGDSDNEVLVLMQGTNMAMLAAYGPTANKAEKGPPFEQKWMLENVHGKEALLSMCTVPRAAACAGKGIAITCSTKKDARVFDMQGKELAKLDPNSLLNHSLVVSRDGRFAAVASFTSEIRFWELKWEKGTGAFRGPFKAMELKGHKSQVMCAAISADNKRAVTASKDGTLRVWRIDVRYELDEDPKCTIVIAMPLPPGKVYQHVEFGPDGVIAASHEGMVHLISADRGDLLESIDAHEKPITSLSWCPRKVKTPGASAPHAVLATSSLDHKVRLWRWP
ncbi:WD40-repeat-containing domain protein [Dunaliella salina]|uniref:WD40-repeat-containing domain protein n=1 Tax=Dunaliella salina TaxID=3046 RepID=A0ABQ7HAI5_DUNSA|nr:WD40-repeat-containing domain protein [Dunaliella salina]|eukprot:KAF5843867.1 WD40-repeat-containing domain protein [Dunaliella salina]